ncbi:DNA methyltransferase [Mycobacterium phage Abrogate]|uniref:DNA methyltransferase n=1 Tax=Mycobacterium phage Abrogate TaxID=1551710 RepID=UPI00051A9CE4|nr:DNA methyltransferase [Mycobacterium phage Abrogate]AIT13202.1 DNA methyltransferase [Mycobacterium phage Abrogate]
MSNVDLRLGDCRDILTELEDNSVDAILTDPPYELGFMGKKWDGSGIAFDVEMWEQCLRVLKPGGHLLAFGGSRTWHRLTVAIEDAGFEIRDSIAWINGSGFPKSASIYKQTIKTLEERYGSARCDCLDPRDGQPDQRGIGVGPGRSEPRRVISDSESGWPKADAKVCSWCGLPDADWLASLEPLGTALKPSFEPIVVARKPLVGTVAANVLEHGTGALNIDACRIGTAQGRWPTNVVLDDAQAAELDAQSGISTSRAGKRNAPKDAGIFGAYAGNDPDRMGHDDSGGASRFFPVFKYQAKAPTKERPSYVNEDGTKVAHSTVKPLTLMRWLARLVCPPGGVILDPFAGSGTTVEACLLEGFDCIAIENEADYIPLIEHRISRSTT